MDVHFKRTDRVAEQIQKSLAMLIQKSLKDPRLGMITVNEVRVTKDLAYADVYFSVFPDEHAKQTELLLSNASSFFAKTVGVRAQYSGYPQTAFPF